MGHYTILPFEFTYDFDDVPFPSRISGPGGCEDAVLRITPSIEARLSEGGRLDFLLLEPHPDPDDASILRGAAGFFLEEDLDSESLFRLQTHVVMPFISFVDEESAERGLDPCRVCFGTDFGTPVRGEEEWVWERFVQSLKDEIAQVEADADAGTGAGTAAEMEPFRSTGYSLLVARLLRDASHPA